MIFSIIITNIDGDFNSDEGDFLKERSIESTYALDRELFPIQSADHTMFA